MKSSIQISNIKYQISVVFIVGPTASGKSALAMELARRLNGEIVCADSQTIRRGLDIGTAKPSVEDQNEIKHHMIDIVGPYESFSVNQFKKMALDTIEDIRFRGKIPIVVGGTGLYVDALYFDFDVDELTDSSDYKNELEQLTVLELQEIITKNNYPMPTNSQNPRHLIGVILRAGKVYENKRPIKGALIYGLMPDDETLKQRINDRVDLMFEHGFVDEVRELIKNYGRPYKKMDAIGYPICMSYLDGEITLDEAKEKFKSRDWQYARRQKSWFKRNPNIKWFQDADSALAFFIN